MTYLRQVPERPAFLKPRLCSGSRPHSEIQSEGGCERCEFGRESVGQRSGAGLRRESKFAVGATQKQKTEVASATKKIKQSQ
jgi:hypothetical protein